MLPESIDFTEDTVAVCEFVADALEVTETLTEGDIVTVEDI